MPAGRYVGIVVDERHIPREIVSNLEDIQERIDQIFLNCLMRIGSSVRVYDDEIPLPSPNFCHNRSTKFLNRGNIFVSKAWIKLGLLRIEEINSLKTI